MKTFQEWLADKGKMDDAIEEGFLKNAALALGAAGAIAAGASAMGGRGMNPHQSRPSATRMADDFDDENEEAGMMAKEAKLRAAAKRVGIPKSQWGRLKGHMIGGIVTVVNGKKVPLTPKEAAEVKAVQELARRMGN